MKKDEIKSVLFKRKGFVLTDSIILSITDELFDLMIDDITLSIFDEK